MNVYLSEQEQIELLKRLWRKYGVSLLIAVSLGMLAGYAWRAWQTDHTETLQAASSMYEQVLNDKNRSTQQQSALYLQTHYPNTTYAALGSLWLAKQAVSTKDLKTAHQHLRWVLDHTTQTIIKDLARIEEARLLLAEQQFTQALSTLETLDTTTLKPLAASVQGDVYFSQNNQPAAAKAYASALENSANITDTLRPLIAMKLAELSNSTQTETHYAQE